MTEKRLSQILDITNEGYDDISYAKRKIGERLCQDADIIEVLNNPDLDPSIPEDYINVNIYPYLLIPEIQPDVKNYICFEIDDTEDLVTNNIMMTKVLTFLVVAESKNIRTKWGINRHDLLGYLVKDLFNWSNVMGNQIKKFYDMASVSNNGYYYRIIKFKTIAVNGLVNGVNKNKYD